MEIVEIQAGDLSSEGCLEAVRSQFLRFDEDLVIRFNLTGRDKIKDLPRRGLSELRAEMSPIFECQFAINAGQKWIMR